MTIKPRGTLLGNGPFHDILFEETVKVEDAVTAVYLFSHEVSKQREVHAVDERDEAREECAEKRVKVTI